MCYRHSWARGRASWARRPAASTACRRDRTRRFREAGVRLGGVLRGAQRPSTDIVGRATTDPPSERSASSTRNGRGVRGGIRRSGAGSRPGTGEHAGRGRLPADRDGWIRARAARSERQWRGPACRQCQLARSAVVSGVAVRANGEVVPASKRGRVGVRRAGGYRDQVLVGRRNRAGRASCDEEGCGRRSRPAPVGSFAANPFGVHDMNGNVWEWVQDCWHKNYKGAPTNGRPRASASCRLRVVRGGGYRDPWRNLRSANRWSRCESWQTWCNDERRDDLGFRVALSLTD